VGVLTFRVADSSTAELTSDKEEPRKRSKVVVKKICKNCGVTGNCSHLFFRPTPFFTVIKMSGSATFERTLLYKIRHAKNDLVKQGKFSKTSISSLLLQSLRVPLRPYSTC
jgi:hypothetical protein